MNSVQNFGLCLIVFRPFSVAKEQEKNSEVNYYVGRPGSTFKIVVIVILGRCVCRTPTISKKIELFVSLVSGFQPLTNATKKSTLDFAWILNTPLVRGHF